VPDIPTPLCDDKRVWVVSTIGMVYCLDAATGKTLFDVELDFDVNTSPTLAGGNVYFFQLDGESTVYAAANEAKVVGKGKLSDRIFASPACVNGRIYVRGKHYLWCIEPGAKSEPVEPVEDDE